MTKRNANGLGSIRKRKDGRYEYIQWITYVTGERKKKSFYGRTKAEAVRKYRDFTKEVAMKLSSNTNITVKEYMLKYFLPMKKLSLKPSSYYRLCKTVDYQIIPNIGSVYMQQLTKYNIIEMLKNLEEKGDGVSIRKKAYYAISSCCKFAMGEVIMTNPCAQVPVPSAERGTEKTIIFLTSEEIKIFKETLFKQYNNGTYVYGKNRWTLFLQLQTGLRPGEVCGLLYKDIKFDKQGEPVFIHVSHEALDGFDKTTMSEKTKPQINSSVKTTTSVRDVPLNENAKKAIKALIEVNRPQMADDPLITDNDGGILAPQNLTRIFNRVIKATKGEIPLFKTGAHTLRRTFATQLFERNMDVKMVSKLMGHTSIQTTLDIYVGLSKTKMDKELEKFDNI